MRKRVETMRCFLVSFVPFVHRRKVCQMQKIANSVKRTATVAFAAALSTFAVQTVSAQKIEFAKEKKAVVKHHRFVGDHREESMWSALYGAKSGKIYIGLCCHAEAAHFYEFDPATETMRHIVDLTELHEERGEPHLPKRINDTPPTTEHSILYTDSPWHSVSFCLQNFFLHSPLLILKLSQPEKESGEKPKTKRL